MFNTPDAQVRAMRSLCDDISASIAQGDVPAESMADLKTTVDETRMRLWASMEAAKSDDPAFVQEFWLRRAAEMCQNIIQHLEMGELDTRSPRADALRGIAAHLATSLTPPHN